MCCLQTVPTKDPPHLSYIWGGAPLCRWTLVYVGIHNVQVHNAPSLNKQRQSSSLSGKTETTITKKNWHAACTPSQPLTPQQQSITSARERTKINHVVRQIPVPFAKSRADPSGHGRTQHTADRSRIDPAGTLSGTREGGVCSVGAYLNHSLMKNQIQRYTNENISHYLLISLCNLHFPLSHSCASAGASPNPN